MRYFKFIHGMPNRDEGMTYKEGRNQDPLPFNPDPYSSSGIHFFSLSIGLSVFLTAGSELYEVTIPEGVTVVAVGDGTLHRYKAPEVDLTYIGNWEKTPSILRGLRG